MNRSHPYAGYSAPREAPPHGPNGGPDRRGRGVQRGSGSFTQPYSSYDSASSQDPFYTNPAYTAGPAHTSHSQGYGNDYQGAGGSSHHNQAKPRPVYRPRDDKQTSIIEDRIQRERPCRTLFTRNIKYETSSDSVRRMFEDFGEIKTFFDLISTRGMVFVTYYDIRAAERARDSLQGAEISARPIDVHYALGKNDSGKHDRNDSQKPGAVQVTLRDSTSGQPIDEHEVRHKFQQFGEVKAVLPVNSRTDSRYVEFYDTRACEEAFDRLRHQGLQDGVMDIVLAWDVNDDNQGGGSQRRHSGGAGSQRDSGRNWDNRGGRAGGGQASSQHSRGSGVGYQGSGGGGSDWNRGSVDDYGRDRGRASYDEQRDPPPRTRGIAASGSFNGFDSRRMGEPAHSAYNLSSQGSPSSHLPYNNKNRSYNTPPPSSAPYNGSSATSIPPYNPPPITYPNGPPSANYNGLTPNATHSQHPPRTAVQALPTPAPPTPNSQQATGNSTSVLELLAALNKNKPAPTTSVPPSSVSYITPSTAPAPNYPQPPPAPYYGGPPPLAPGVPAPSGYAAPPAAAMYSPYQAPTYAGPSSYGQAPLPTPAASTTGLPANLLAMMQQEAQAQSYRAGPALPNPTGPPTPAPSNETAGYQHLMSYLQTQKRQ